MSTNVKFQQRLLGAALAGILCAGAETGFGEDANVVETIEELKRQIEVLDQKVRELERQQATNNEAANEKARSTPVLSIGEDGFAMRSANGDFNLRLRSLVQADSRLYFGDSENHDGFLIRRARLELAGTVFRQFDFRVLPEFAGSSPTLLEAWLDWQLGPRLQILAGKSKMPVGLERWQSTENRLMTELSYPTGLVPNRDVGVAVHGALLETALNYYAGVFNGATDGSNSASNPENDVSFAGRLFATPFDRSETSIFHGLGFGIGGTYGNAGGEPSNYNSVGQQTVFEWLPDTTIDGSTWRLVPQAYYFHGPFGVMGEYAISSQRVRRGAASGTIQNQGWQVTASYVLTGEEASFRGVKPANPFDPANGGWGAWQLVARITELDVDDDAFPAFADPAASASLARSYGGGLNWYLNSLIRVSGDYNFTEFQGAPRPDEHVFITRVQLRF